VRDLVALVLDVHDATCLAVHVVVVPQEIEELVRALADFAGEVLEQIEESLFAWDQPESQVVVPPSSRRLRMTPV
jgi:hypothetical protein